MSEVSVLPNFLDGWSDMFVVSEHVRGQPFSTSLVSKCFDRLDTEVGR